MVRSLLRNICLYVVSLFILPFIIPGVKIVGGIFTLFTGGLALTFMFLVLKPIFNVLTFPFNLISLGLFSTLTNALILYLLTKFVPNIIITEFTFSGANLAGFNIPAIPINTFFAYVTSAIVISVISGFIRWVISSS
jgi:putative membrane protein